MMGNKLDDGKPDWTLLPMRPLIEIIKVLEFGKRKYARDNWQQVPDARRRYLAAAFRHLAAVNDGEWLDLESGLSHLAHAACCLVFLLWFGKEDNLSVDADDLDRAAVLTQEQTAREIARISAEAGKVHIEGDGVCIECGAPVRPVSVLGVVITGRWCCVECREIWARNNY